MSLLQTAQNSWQSKVGDKDVDKFTVAGKMGGSTPNSKRPSRKESEMNAVNETHQPTVFFFFSRLNVYSLLKLYLLAYLGPMAPLCSPFGYG